jgi:hypothetical protein
MADAATVRDISDKLENGVKALFESEKYAEYLKTMSRFHQYSTRNTLLIHLQAPDARRVGGFRFWQKEFNRHVKKGEHGIKIFAPIANKGKEIEVEKLDPVTKLPILDENGQPIMERLSPTSNLQVRFKLVTVFSEQQTDGDPLPSLVEPLNGDVERYELFMDALRAVSPLPIEFEQMPSDTDGTCYFGDRIAIREGMSEVQTVSAVLHEICHATCHDASVMVGNGENPKDRRTQECEAESVSFCVASFYKIDTGANAFGYIATWASGKELKELNASLDTIRKTSAKLIDAINEKFTELAKERGIDLTSSHAGQALTVEQEESAMTEITGEPEKTRAKEEPVEYTAFQKQGFAYAESQAHLPRQERLDIIAQTFNCKTAHIETHPCTGKWRGTSDISIVFDNGASLFIGNRKTPDTKKASGIDECVNAALASYNPQTVAEAKRIAGIKLLEHEREDNKIAAELGLKPYKFLNVELCDGTNIQNGGFIGWYYATLEVDGKIFGICESGLNYGISRGEIDSRPNYFVAGGLKESDADFVFKNVGHSSTKDDYKIPLIPDDLQRARETLARRERFREALKGMKTMENKPTLENRLYDKLNELFPDFMSRKYSYMKLESPGMEPLSLEWTFGDHISVMHTYELNGDLCYDPMIDFVVDSEKGTLTASAFEQSIPPIYQYHGEDGIGRSVDGNGKEREVKDLSRQIGDFAKDWFNNIEQQGYTPVRAILWNNGGIDEVDVEVTFDSDGNAIMPEEISQDRPVREELPYDEAAWHDLADIEDDDLRAERKAEINELLNRGKASDKADEKPKATEIDLSLPDSAWTQPEMFEYGYTEPDMFPLSEGRALELFDTGHPIYLLYPDNTEALVWERDEIITFSSDGFCGITAADWENSPVRAAQLNVAASINDTRENARESEMLTNTPGMFGIYQIKDGIDEARNFRFASMKELEAHGLTPDRKNYELVYTAPLDIHDVQINLHKVYQDFNIYQPPADFKGHSVSVSDIIVLQWRGEVSSHYVDSVGFKELPSFIGNEREQKPPMFQFDTSKTGQKHPLPKTEEKRGRQKPATKAAPTLMDEIKEASRMVRRSGQQMSKQNEREV